MVSKKCSSAKPAKICPDEDEHVAFLNASGRWVERLIAMEGSHEHIVASLYGYSGASSDNSKYQDNERLIVSATARMVQMGRVPYFICTDLNIDPRESEGLCKARQLGMIHDVVADRTCGELPMTYDSSRDLKPGMQGKGTSRIDTILANHAGAQTAEDVRYVYLGAKGYDHIPITISTNLTRFDDDVQIAARPVELTIKEVAKTAGQREKDENVDSEDVLSTVVLLLRLYTV